MSSSVFVRNLPFDVTKESLEEVFGAVGPVKRVDLIKDKGKRKFETVTRGFAFVRFATEGDAALAIDKLNHSDLHGRKMQVEIAAEKKPKRKQRNQQPPPDAQQHEEQQQAEQNGKQLAQPDEAQQQNQPKEKEVEQTQAEPEAEQPQKDKKKTKTEKEKKAKKSNEQRQEHDNEKPVVEPKKADKPAKAADKKKKQVPKQEDQSDATTSSQSERNARRRMHREFLRQVRDRKEASASENEKSITIFNIAADVPKKKLLKLVKRHAALSEFILQDPNAPTNAETEHDSEQAPAKKNTKKMAIVQLKLLKDVDTVISKLDGQVLNGNALQVRQGRLTDEDFRPVKASTTSTSASKAKPVLTAKAQQQGLRLIIRNLSFQVTDEDLEKTFEDIGPLYEARVVRMPVAEEEAGDDDGDDDDDENAETSSKKKKPVLGRSRGFGFVQFRDLNDARKAVEAKNGLKIKGREIVVDFAVPKAKYLQQQTEEVAEKQDEEQGDDDESAENEDPEHDEDDEEPQDDAEDAKDEDGDEEQEEEEDEEEEEPVDKKNKKDTAQQMERTLFIRNLSFQSTDESLKAFFETFGQVEYARVVYDYASGLSKGVAFVRFKSKQVADRVLAESAQSTVSALVAGANDDKKAKKKQKPGQLSANLLQPQTGLLFDARVISVAPAVQKEQADLIAENLHGTKKKDKRNLYLASEGTINVNKIAEEDLNLPKGDIEKRRRALQEKKTKLKNPLFFVSPTRLSVRNVAGFVDDKLLKKIFKDAATEGMAEDLVDVAKEVPLEYRLPDTNDEDAAAKKTRIKVKMAKIVREEDAKPGKEPRSRGYGFVEFEHHVHALAALRKLNNNPAFTKYTPGGAVVKGGKKPKLEDHEKPRLIVEFALENHAKLKLREKRQHDAEKRREEEKHLREAQGAAEDEDQQEEGSKKRKSRGQRQREAKKARKESQAASTTQTKSDAGSKKRPREEKNSDMKNKKTKTQERQKSTKKKPAQDDVEMALVQDAAAMASGATKDGKKLSRKQRKAETQREKHHENNFEDMVREYKKQLFGGSDVAKGSGSSKERWFETE